MGRFLRGVPRLDSDSEQPFTPIGSLNAALQSVGLHTSYSQLMFLGGGAFRIGWSRDWSTLNAVACAEDIVANAAASQGFSAEAYVDLGLEESWAKIKASVDAGIPVLVSGLASEEEWAVIVGYEDEPIRVFLRSYDDKSSEPAIVNLRAWNGWTYKGVGLAPLITLTRTGRVLDEGKAIPAALERAVRFAEESEFNFAGRPFYSGPRAYSEMAGSIRDVCDGVGAEEAGERVRVLNLTLGAVIDARHAAIDHLEIVKHLGARKQIYDATVAVDRYGREIRELQAAAAELPWQSGKPRREALAEAAELAGDEGRRERCAAAIWRAGEEEGNAVGALSRILRFLPPDFKSKP